MGTRERKVEQYLRKRVQQEYPNSLVEKWGTDGNPDRIVFHKGKSYFCEIKTVDGSLQSNQIRQIARIRDTGNIVFTLEGHKDVEWFVRMLQRPL